MKSGLVQKKIRDKNGKLTTVWVRTNRVADDLKFSKDPMLDVFYSEINKKVPLSRNPFMPSEFMYGDKAMLNLSRFDMKDRREVEFRDVMVLDKKQGTGTKIMEHLIEVADKLNYKVKLYAKPFGEGKMDIASLVKFYKKFGFVVDWERAYGGEFNSEKELMDYVKDNPDEGMPMYRPAKPMHWRQAYQDTNDPMRKGDILRAAAESKGVTTKELKDIEKLAVGLPEQNNILHAVKLKKKSEANDTGR